MPLWKAKLDIKRFIDEVAELEAVPDDDVRKLAGNIHGAIVRFMAGEGAGIGGLGPVREAFLALSMPGGATGEALAATLDGVLEDLYAWGDANRVWLGGPWGCAVVIENF
jgi:hypothetical protein